MFVDVTRYGGMRVTRLAVAAIAYLDACEGGTSIHLLGGETLRVNEDPAEIEARSSARGEEPLGKVDPDKDLAAAEIAEGLGLTKPERVIETRVVAATSTGRRKRV